MTINSTEYRTDWLLADGANKEWPYDFSILSSADLFLETRSGADGAISEVTSNISFFPSADFTEGYVVYPAAGAALAAPMQVRVVRRVPYTQETEIGNEGSFRPKIHENAFDRLTMQTQQLAGETLRALKVPVGLEGPEVLEILEEDQFYKADADGNLVLGGSAADIITAAAAAASIISAVALVEPTFPTIAAAQALNLSFLDRLRVLRPWADAFYAPADYKKVLVAPTHDSWFTDAGGNMWEYANNPIGVLAQAREADAGDIALAIGRAFDVLIKRNNNYGLITCEPRPDGLPYEWKTPVAKIVKGRWKLDLAGVWIHADNAFRFDGPYAITRLLRIGGEAPTELNITQAWSKIFKVDPPVPCRPGLRVGIWDTDFAARGWDLDASTGTNNHGPATYTNTQICDANGYFMFKKDITFPVATNGGADAELDTTDLAAVVWLDDSFGEISGPAVFEADLLENGHIPGTFIETIPVANVNIATNTITVTEAYANNDLIVLESDDVPPTGLSLTTTYHVVNAAAGSIQLSLTEGGAAVDITGIGSGNLTLRTPNIYGQSAGGASAFGFEFDDGQYIVRDLHMDGFSGCIYVSDADLYEHDNKFLNTYNGNAVTAHGFCFIHSENPTALGIRHYSFGSSAGRGLVSGKMVGGRLSSEKQSLNPKLSAGENSCPLDTHGGADEVDIISTEIDGGVNVSRHKLNLTAPKIICGQTNGAFLIRTDGSDGTTIKMKGGEIIIPRYTNGWTDTVPPTGIGNFSTTLPFQFMGDDAGANGLTGYELYMEGVHFYVDDPNSWPASQDFWLVFNNSIWNRVQFTGCYWHFRGTPFRRINVGLRGNSKSILTFDDCTIDGSSILLLGPAGFQACRQCRLMNSRVYNTDPVASFPTAVQFSGDTSAASVFEGPDCDNNEIESIGTTAMVLISGSGMLKNNVRNNRLTFMGDGTTLNTAIDVARNRNSNYDLFLSDLTGNKIFDRTGNTITADIIVRDHDANPGGLGAPVAFFDFDGTTRPVDTGNGNLSGQRMVKMSERVDPIERNHLRSFLTADLVLANVATVQNFLPAGQDEFALEASTQYAFEGTFNYSRSAGTTSHFSSILFGGTATLTAISYEVETAQAADTGLAARKSRRSSSAAALAVTSSSVDATEVVTITVKGNVRVNAAGTFIPQLQYSAAPGGAPTVAAGSFFEMRKIGTAARTTAGSVS